MRVWTVESWSIVLDNFMSLSSTEPTHLLRATHRVATVCTQLAPCKRSCRQVSHDILQKRKHRSKVTCTKNGDCVESRACHVIASNACPLNIGGTSSKAPMVNSAAFSASFELSGFSCWNTRHPLVVITRDSTPPNMKANFCKRSRSRSWLVYAPGRKSHARETNLCSHSNVQNKPWINIEPFWTLRSSGHWGLASHR